MLCIWRVNGEQTACEKFGELITALQWKPIQPIGDPPLLLMGLVSGEVVLVEVMRANVNLTPEIHVIKIEYNLIGEECVIEV